MKFHIIKSMIVLSLSLLPSLGQLRADSVPGVVIAGTNRARTLHFPRQTIRIQNELDQLMELHAIHIISKQLTTTKPQYTIKTTCGETWVGTILNPTLRAEYQNETEQINLDDWSFGRISLSPTEQPDAPPGHARLFLQSGTEFWVQPDRTHIDMLGPDQQPHSIPLGSLASTTFSTDAPREHLIATALFPNAIALGGTIPDPDASITMRNTHGNRFTIRYADIRQIEGPHPLPEPRPPTPDGTDATINGTFVSWSGSMVESPVHFSVLKIASIHGTMHLPTPLLQAIYIDPNPTESATVTIFGEVFKGRHLTPTILLPPEKTPALIEIQDQMTAHFQSPRLPPPAKGRFFTLRNNETFFGIILDDVLTVRADRENVDIETVNLLSIQREQNDYLFSFNNTQILGTPRGRNLNIMRLTDGQILALPWRSLASLTPPPDELPDPSTLPQAAQESIFIKGGEFLMGCPRGEGMPDERPPVRITLSDFFMDAHPVTRQQFEQFNRETSYQTRAERHNATLTWENPGFPQDTNHPVVMVSWFDAVRYCNWRSRRDRLDPVYQIRERGSVITVEFDPRNNGWRLPTEAEWEYAARAQGQDIIYPWGNENSMKKVIHKANFHQRDDRWLDDWEWTNPVRYYPPNKLGLYDMAGNIWEWCQDWYHERAYRTILRQQPVNPCVDGEQFPGLDRRVMRGGSFDNELDMLRCASRGHGVPYAYANRVGFRCVRNAAR